MTNLDDLTQQLDKLAASVPEMIEANADPSGFWLAFAGEADVIEDRAGDHAAYVFQRLQGMLAPHGMSIGVMEAAEE